MLSEPVQYVAVYINIIRGGAAYPLFERSRPPNVCGRFGRATALTEKNRSDSFDIRMESATLHAYIDGRPTNRLRLSCGSAEPYRQEKLRPASESASR